MAKILIVDDEQDILTLLKYNVELDGHTAYTALNGKEAIDLARKILPDLILLDVMMPEMDGIETCEKIRGYKELNNVIIAFLTARNEDYSQIAGFDAGGDDYISKPIKPKVLISRINALLRRTPKIEEETRQNTNTLIIDREKYLVFKNEKEITLPKKEFELLALLHSKPGKVFSRDEILENVWGKDIVVGDRTIDVHVRKLREKVGENYIKTVKGVGYKFED